MQSLQSFASAVPPFHEAPERHIPAEDNFETREQKVIIRAARSISRVVLTGADKGRALSKSEWN